MIRPCSLSAVFRRAVFSALLVCACSGAEPVTTAPAPSAPPGYADRLRAMWLGECIANWTGLVTESVRRRPPFFTDEDWGTRRGNPAMNGGWIDFVLQSPWGADDDTDIEYIYLDAMTRTGGDALSPREIRDAWLRHVEPGVNVWVSNNEARKLMGAEVRTLPPSTSLLAANDQSLMIDGQLTTEIFGALCPGMPVEALALADLPIRVTASGHAAHACQFHVALYALAAVDREGPLRERIVWMVETARRLIPDGSKTADVIDFVLADHRANPDPDDWERTRDAVARRYQLEDAEHGFRYLGYYESSVNLATGLTALLYGEGDFRRTVRIGTLSGWDCDNGTATMGGLLGLLLGTGALGAAFPDEVLSDAYDILRTRTGFEPPVCPDDHPNCVDTFAGMAERMLPMVARRVEAAGGRVDRATGDWRLPEADFEALSAEDNPLTALHRSSASNRLWTTGDEPSVSWEGVAWAGSGPSGSGGSEVADGLEFDFSGADRRLEVRDTLPMFFGFPGTVYHALAVPDGGGGDIRVTVSWERPLEIRGVRFVEGPHVVRLLGREWAGGFASVSAAVLGPEGWIPVPGTPAAGPPSPSVAFEVLEWSLDRPVPATAVRLVGVPYESAPFVTVAELEGILP